MMERIKCSVCDNEFEPKHDLDFVCVECLKKLHCPVCKSDDVVMDWHVELDEGLPYFWLIECVCGASMNSERTQDLDETAKKLHAAWTAR